MDEHLKQIVSDWAFRREREASPTGWLDKPQLPAWLLACITGVEPFRAQAIEDARAFWAMPMPFGFGMELFFPGSISIEPFENWPQTIHKFAAEMEYCERMDGTNCYRYDVKLERLGREAGAWRIIEVFSNAERAQFLKMFFMLKEIYAAQKERK